MQWVFVCLCVFVRLFLYINRLAWARVIQLTLQNKEKTASDNAKFAKSNCESNVRRRVTIALRLLNIYEKFSLIAMFAVVIVIAAKPLYFFVSQLKQAWLICVQFSPSVCIIRWSHRQIGCLGQQTNNSNSSSSAPMTCLYLSRFWIHRRLHTICSIFNQNALNNGFPTTQIVRTMHWLRWTS